MSITFRLALYIVLLWAATFVAAAQQSQGESKHEQSRDKATEFAATQLAALGRSTGMPITFEGLIPLPTELNSLALQTLPKHRFTVARFKAGMNLNVYDSHLLIVSDAESGEIVSHIYDPVIGGPVHESFRNLFAAYKPRSRDDALQKVGILARLIGYPGRRAGSASLRSGAVEAAIYWGDKPWRILRTKLGPDLKLGRILLINPVSGKDWDKQAEELRKEFK